MWGIDIGITTKIGIENALALRGDVEEKLEESVAADPTSSGAGFGFTDTQLEVANKESAEQGEEIARKVIVARLKSLGIEEPGEGTGDAQDFYVSHYCTDLEEEGETK